MKDKSTIVYERCELKLRGDPQMTHPRTCADARAFIARLYRMIEMQKSLFNYSFQNINHFLNVSGAQATVLI